MSDPKDYEKPIDWEGVDDSIADFMDSQYADDEYEAQLYYQSLYEEAFARYYRMDDEEDESWDEDDWDYDYPY